MRERGASPGPTLPPRRSRAASAGSGSRGASSAPPFAAGTIAAERFRIVRLLGRGGMGDVYEAEDAALGERVALKTIRPEIAADPGAIDRFKQEIQLARRVTHPNACRVFDLWIDAERGPFVTMELLAGETLEERITRGGAMSAAEALPVARQMIDGLAAAHAVGVIHRDFKSGNVMLVGAGAADDAIDAPDDSRVRPTQALDRAVVTDFGLALAAHAGAESAANRERLVGSPGYMAPEQVEGGEITRAADIYALGVVLFEMRTGRLPFEGDSDDDVARRRVSEAAPSARDFAPRIETRWEQAIARCLTRDPRERFASARDVLDAIAGETSRARKRGARWLAGAAVAATVVAVVAGLEVGRRDSTPPGAPAENALAPLPGDRASVAVLGFRNETGRDANAWLSTALAEMFARDLAAGERFRLLPNSHVEDAKSDLGIADAESLTAESLARLRGALDADYVLCGAFECPPSDAPARAASPPDDCGAVRVAVRLQEVDGGRMVAALDDTTASLEVAGLVARACDALRENLGVVRLSTAEAGEAHSAYPANTEAARAYAEGVRLLRIRDAIAARASLEAAVAADPDFPLARSELSNALAALGYQVKAREEARAALEKSAGLSRKERLLIEARCHAANGDWRKAVENYRTLWLFYPDQTEFGLALAEAQRSGGMNVEALTTVDSLRALPPPAGNDPRLRLTEAEVAFSLSKYDRSKEAAADAAAEARARGLRTFTARARRSEGNALQRLGDTKAARAALHEAVRLSEESGNKGNLTASLQSLGLTMYSAGELDSAETIWRSALATAREIGNLTRVGDLLNNLAVAQMRRDQPDTAMKYYEEALALQREVGSREGQFSPLFNIADILNDRGDHAGARAMREEALAIAREVGDRRREAVALHGLAHALKDEGDIGGARRMIDQAVAIHRELGAPADIARALHFQGMLMRFAGELKEAVRTREEGLALLRKAGQKEALPAGLAGLAGTLLAQGDIPRARALVDESIAISREMRDRPHLATCLLVAGDLLHAQDRLDSARGSIQEALALNDSMGATVRAAECRAYLARVMLDEGRPREAAKSLDGVADGLRAGGELDLEIVVRTTRAEALLEAGDLSAAERELTESRALLAKSQMREGSLATNIVTGRLQSAQGRAAEALATLTAARDEAARLGFGYFEFEARLALGEHAMRSGDSAAGRVALEALEREAAQRGLARVARRSAEHLRA